MVVSYFKNVPRTHTHPPILSPYASHPFFTHAPFPSHPAWQAPSIRSSLPWLDRPIHHLACFSYSIPPPHLLSVDNLALVLVSRPVSICLLVSQRTVDEKVTSSHIWIERSRNTPGHHQPIQIERLNKLIVSKFASPLQLQTLLANAESSLQLRMQFRRIRLQLEKRFLKIAFCVYEQNRNCVGGTIAKC